MSPVIVQYAIRCPPVHVCSCSPVSLGKQIALVDDAFVPALCEAVPELRHYSTDSGLPFRSAKLPSLRLCMHTGFDREPAILNFRSVLLYTPPVSPLEGINGQASREGLCHVFEGMTDGRGRAKGIREVNF